MGPSKNCAYYNIMYLANLWLHSNVHKSKYTKCKVRNDQFN